MGGQVGWEFFFVVERAVWLIDRLSTLKSCHQMNAKARFGKRLEHFESEMT